MPPLFIPCVCAGSDPVAPGIFALFYNRNNTDVNTTEKYTFATNVVSSGTNLTLFPASSSGQCSATNGVTGYFAGGSNAGVALDETEKYDIATDAVSAGALLGTARTNSAFVCNVDVGYVAGGAIVNPFTVYVDTTERYTFSSDTVAAGVTLSVTNGVQAGAGDGTQAIFAGGRASNFAPSAILAYTIFYDTDSLSSVASLNQGRDQHAASYDGLGHVFFFGGFNQGTGTPIDTVDDYNISGNSMTARTVLPAGRYTQASQNAVPDTADALIAAGQLNAGPTNTTLRYNFTTYVSAAATSLTVARAKICGF